MKLMVPVVVTPPSLTLPDGTVRVFNPITLDELVFTIVDSPKNKVCAVQIRPCPKPLILWEKETYDAIGDYTQAQVDARINELLGDDPSKVLNSLYPTPLVK